MRIAIVEDDSVQAQQLKQWLIEAGHNVHWHNNGNSFNQAITRESFDLAILDWNLPDTTGIELLKKMRADHITMPVIFMTSRDAEEDIVSALQTGADDYLVKPARQAETLARIAVLERRSTGYQEQTQALDYPPYSLNSEHFTVQCNDEIIQLTHKEFDLARFMFQNNGRLLSRGHILESVWGLNSDITTRTVDSHMSKLRRKLSLTPEHGWRMVSVYQFGYRLEAIDDSEIAKT